MKEEERGGGTVGSVDARRIIVACARGECASFFFICLFITGRCKKRSE